MGTGNTFVDWLLSHYAPEAPPPPPKAPPVPVTRVKYTFNRRLTWSEREALAEYLSEDHDFIEHKVKRDDPRIVTVTYADHVDSRVVTLIVSEFAETLLNVHPVSAHTLEPKVRV